jgi:hypothetical protein
MSMAQSKNALKRYEDNLNYDPVDDGRRMKGLPRKTPPIKIPLVIVLKDGRIFDTVHLLKSVGVSKSITLNVIRPPDMNDTTWTDFVKENRNPQERRGAPEKYTKEMRMWIAMSSAEDVMARFQTTKGYARKMVHMYREEFGLPSIKKRQ